MGLEAEFATHNRIKGLSGGQKVKVVLAACMWEDPHILVLDEPTNYLDRDSLGALAAGQHAGLVTHAMHDMVRRRFRCMAIALVTDVVHA